MAKSQKIVIVHDWLIGGGAELVVEQLHKLYPDAPIYTSYCTDEWRKRLDNKVITGWLQHFGKVRKFIPFLRAWWFSHLNLSDYDLVISSSGAEAKGVKVSKGALHVSYIHAPTHYYWSRYDEYMKHPGFGPFDWLARIGLRLLVAPLRKWDYKAAQRPDYLIANSTHIKNEIEKYYHRDATVIYPPVYFDRFQKPENADLPRKDYLVSGRQTPYKRFDLAIQACNELNAPLTVIGNGPDNQRLRKLAGPTINFLGRVSDAELEVQFASAKALIFPGLDDFGITPVEALAAGTPVVAYSAGGALDYVIPGRTGELFSPQTSSALVDLLKRFDANTYKRSDLRATAQTFSAENFRQKFSSYITNLSKS